VHERRGLLQGLEHAVGRLVAELIGTLDHEHPAAGLKRRLARRRDHRLVDVRDQDLVGAAGDHPGEIGMGAAPHPGARAVGVRLALGQQLGGQRSRGGALAGATGPMKQIGVRGR